MCVIREPPLLCYHNAVHSHHHGWKGEGIDFITGDIICRANINQVEGYGVIKVKWEIPLGLRPRIEMKPLKHLNQQLCGKQLRLIFRDGRKVQAFSGMPPLGAPWTCRKVQESGIWPHCRRLRSVIPASRGPLGEIGGGEAPIEPANFAEQAVKGRFDSRGRR